jgi:hypothetical protein
MMDGTASAGTATTLSRSDHRHPSDTSKISTSEKGAASGVASLGSDGKVPSEQLPTIPSASSATPQNLGTAAAGSSTDYSRADHVHNKPTPSDIGAQPTITASGILKGNGAGGISVAVAGTDYPPANAGIYPGTSSTAAATQAKVGTVPGLSGRTALYDGLTICMTFANFQDYNGQPTLDIGIPYNGVTAFGINRTSASAAGRYDWGNGSAVDLVFDASSQVWVMKKGQHGSAVRYGVLLLSDSVSENSTTSGGKAATPSAVKTAYDLAASKSQLVRFTAQAVSVASGAEIFRITDSEITTDTEVVSVEFADPSYIPAGGNWTSYAGYVAFTGTCTAATTADVILKI